MQSAACILLGKASHHVASLLKKDILDDLASSQIIVS
jgi:hypothetical protein